MFSLFACIVPSHAAIIDPEIYIGENGSQRQSPARDGVTFYSSTIRLSTDQLTSVEAEVAALPKHLDLFKVCDFLKGGARISIVERTGEEVEAALVNYGYKGKIMSCVFKYSLHGVIGTQIMFYKQSEAKKGAYMVFITD